MPRSTNRKVPSIANLDKVILTREGGFARVEHKQAVTAPALFQMGPQISVPEVHRRPMLEVREPRAKE